MYVRSHFLFYLAFLGSLTSTIYCVLVIIAASRFALSRRREDQKDREFLPPLSVLGPLHGMQPGLEQNLESFFTQRYPKFELIFCARHPTDAGLRLAQRLGDLYPDVKARFITCGEPEFPNAKMWSLTALAKAATYDMFVASDADARVPQDHLLRCIQGLASRRLA